MVFNKRTGTKGKHRPHELIYFVYLFAYFTYNFQNELPFQLPLRHCIATWEWERRAKGGAKVRNSA